MITELFNKLHPIDIENLIVNRITQHTLFRAMQKTMETHRWVPTPSSTTSNIIPSDMYDLAETLNELLEQAKVYETSKDRIPQTIHL